MRWALLACMLAPALARADDALEAAQRAQVEALRAQVASQIQLHAFDLLDELVYDWTQEPPFASPTAVVLASVTVPVGLGAGLAALIENHFASLVVRNPQTNVVLAHCPACTAIVVHSGAQGTVVSRGVDAPEALQKAGALAASRHAIFIDFEAEGASLVMRARVTAIEPALPIVYAKTLSSSTASAALLRAGDHLKSAAEARQEYLALLRGQSPLTVPMRIAVRSYAAPDRFGVEVMTAPFLWLQAGAEIELSQAHAWIAAFSLGYSWAPELHDAWLAQARLARLVSGRTRSLTQPDLYLFFGASVINVQGPDALFFRDELPTVDQLLADQDRRKPRTTFAAWQLGLELRVKNRIGVSAFVETLPGLQDAPSLGHYLDLGLFELHTLGAEVSFCF